MLSEDADQPIPISGGYDLIAIGSIHPLTERQNTADDLLIALQFIGSLLVSLSEVLSDSRSLIHKARRSDRTS